VSLWKPEYIKARVFGTYSDFAAQNLVIDDAGDFTGETIGYGGELEATPFYLWRHAMSVAVGYKVEDITVDNLLGSSVGEALLSGPYVRLSASKNKQHHRSYISVGWEHNFEEIATIGRTNLGR